MSDIPLEICREILLQLPAESLFRFRAVCKAWRGVIDDPCFVKAHTNNQLSSNTLLISNSTGAPFYPLYSFNLKALNFTGGVQTIRVTPLKLTGGGEPRLPALPVATCNGLILIAHKQYKEKKTWEIWNPLTNEGLELPPRDTDYKVVDLVSSGFGYDYAADDYKVVMIDRVWCQRKFLCQTHVYSLKSDSWRMIRDFPSESLSKRGVFLNGALHWRSRDMIIVLDFGTENYRQLSLPSGPTTPETSFKMKLDALGGCLILCCNDRKMNCTDCWVMKDNGAEGSWIKLFSLKESDFSFAGWGLRPAAYLKNKKQVFLQDDDRMFWFDVESNSIKKVGIHGLSGISSQICPGSLFRFRDSCGVSGSAASKRRKRNRKSKRKMKKADTELTFCVREIGAWSCSHESCSSDSSWSSSSTSSSEGED